MPHDFDEMRRQAAGEDIDHIYGVTAHKAMGATKEELMASAYPPKVQPGGTLPNKTYMQRDNWTRDELTAFAALPPVGRFAPRQLEDRHIRDMNKKVGPPLFSRIAEEQEWLHEAALINPQAWQGLPIGTTTGRTPSAHTPPLHQLPSDSPGLASVRAAMHEQRLGRGWRGDIAEALERLQAAHPDKYMLELNADKTLCLAVDTPSSFGWATVRDNMTREQAIALMLALL